MAIRCLRLWRCSRLRPGLRTPTAAPSGRWFLTRSVHNRHGASPWACCWASRCRRSDAEIQSRAATSGATDCGEMPVAYSSRQVARQTGRPSRVYESSSSPASSASGRSRTDGSHRGRKLERLASPLSLPRYGRLRGKPRLLMARARAERRSMRLALALERPQQSTDGELGATASHHGEYGSPQDFEVGQPSWRAVRSRRRPTLSPRVSAMPGSTSPRPPASMLQLQISGGGGRSLS